MNYYQTSIYKGCTAVVLVLLLLTAFCLANVEAGTGSYYLCIFSLLIDVPFFGFLLYKLIKTYRLMKKAEEKTESKTDSPSETARKG